MCFLLLQVISSQLQAGSFGECASSSTALLRDAHTCTRCSGGRWKELWTVALKVSPKVRGQVSLAQCVLSTSSADPQEDTESFNSFHHLRRATVFTIKERTGKAGHPVPTMTPRGTARARGALRRGSSGRESVTQVGGRGFSSCCVGVEPPPPGEVRGEVPPSCWAHPGQPPNRCLGPRV